MFKKIAYVLLVLSLNGCVSSGCIDTNQHAHPEIRSSKTQNCTSMDAAVYVATATIQMLKDDKKSDKKIKKSTKCSDMVGKSQKECTRKERELYDPLDEF